MNDPRAAVTAAGEGPKKTDIMTRYYRALYAKLLSDQVSVIIHVPMEYVCFEMLSNSVNVLSCISWRR